MLLSAKLIRYFETQQLLTKLAVVALMTKLAVSKYLVIIYNSDVTVVALMTKLAVSFTERTIRGPPRVSFPVSSQIDGITSQADRWRGVAIRSRSMPGISGYQRPSPTECAVWV
jgi:hypothetical protein